MFMDRLNIVMYQLFPTSSIDSTQPQSKTLASYFVDIDRLLLKLTWKDKRHRTTNIILEEKNKVGRTDATRQQHLL